MLVPHGAQAGHSRSSSKRCGKLDCGDGLTFFDDVAPKSLWLMEKGFVDPRPHAGFGSTMWQTFGH
jgi:hypothetical protein